MTDWKSSLRADAMPWLLENACPAIRYRVLTELLDRDKDDPEVQKVRLEVMAYGPALKLQRTQRKDGGVVAVGAVSDREHGVHQRARPDDAAL